MVRIVPSVLCERANAYAVDFVERRIGLTRGLSSTTPWADSSGIHSPDIIVL